MRSLVVTLALFAFASSASARMGQRDPVELFAQADTNHDGVISRSEFRAARAARFDRLDRNHDGYLTDADMPRFVRSNADRMQKFHAAWQMADGDHDGRVSRDEFIAAGSRMFDMVDGNRDGVVDQAELQQAAERLRALAEGKEGR